MASRARANVRREAALVADRGRQARLVQRALQRVKHLGSAAQRLGKGRQRPTGITMNSWKSMRVVGMDAAVQDVHHRHRQQIGIDPADIAVQRQADRLGRRLAPSPG